MLHDIINEQGYCLDTRDDISRKKKRIFFHIYPYKFLVFGAKIIFIADYQTTRINCVFLKDLFQEYN